MLIGHYQQSIRALIKKGHLSYLPPPNISELEQAAVHRNSVVHGAPPRRFSITRPDLRGGKERVTPGSAITSEYVEAVIVLALDVFRQTNLQRRRQNDSEIPLRDVRAGVRARYGV